MGISIGLVGLGSFGGAFAPLFKSHPRVDRIGVCDREAAIVDARRAGLRGRAAHMRGECVQLRLQRVHANAACSWRTRASSASNSGNGGKLKSRSSRVGRTPCAR